MHCLTSATCLSQKSSSSNGNPDAQVSDGRHSTFFRHGAEMEGRRMDEERTHPHQRRERREREQ
eukprot:871106-Rhodomonas_salina.1